MEERIIKDVNDLLTQLFSKMHEVGYELDAEKLELRKIEQKPLKADLEKAIANILKVYAHTILCRSLTQDELNETDAYAIENTKKLLDYFVQSKQLPTTWSEEDEKMLKMAITSCEQCGNEYAYYWLKSLKNRVGCEANCTTTKRWSKEDLQIYGYILAIISSSKDIDMGKKVEMIKWFKSLRPQNTWKPSDEQMNTLWDAIVFVEGCNSNFKGSGSVLENLYNDLKKLKG